MKTTKTNTMKIYTDQYGTKTTTEVELVLDKVYNYLNNGSRTSHTTKCNSVKMTKLRREFEALFTDKCEDGFRITSQEILGWNFSDCLA